MDRIHEEGANLHAAAMTFFDVQQKIASSVSTFMAHSDLEGTPFGYAHVNAMSSYQEVRNHTHAALTNIHQSLQSMATSLGAVALAYDKAESTIADAMKAT